MAFLFKHFIRSAIDWLFRRRSPALLVMRLGVACLALAFGAGWALDASLPFRDKQIDIVIDSAGGTPAIVVYAAAIAGLVLIVSGVIWEIHRYRAEQRRLARKKVIVIEGRGLRDNCGSALIDAVPKGLEGYRDHLLVDLRQGIQDGEIVEPEAAINNLITLPVDLKRRENGFDRRDLSIVYGGLTPVPFTFLTGVLMDDEGAISVLDWDRHIEAWRELDSSDDGKRFKFVEDVGMLPEDCKEAALAVSVSYNVIVDDVLSRVGNIPIIELKLDSGSPDSHWSEDKQRGLAQQFLATAIDLSNRGVSRIHLFLAAQNSVAFRFGRLYDKRNLPEIVVHQFMRGADMPYPWGVAMPVCGLDKPAIVWADDAMADR